MSVTVAFDIYPAATPNGSLLVRLLTSGTGTKQAVELSARKVLHGSGEGMIRIHSDHADATSANFAKRNYVKVVLVNGATETEWFGFFMESGDFAAVDRRERGGRMLTFSGPGSFYYLDRAVLLEEIYAPGQTRRGSSDVEGSWWWRDEPYGAITTRALEEGFNQPGSPLAEATWDFDRLVDSASVAWPNIDNEYQVPWGTKVYDLIGNFIKLGLTVTVDADLTFHAWQTYGTNRTSATFAAGKLRFEHGVNIGNDVTRKINANLERSHVFVTGDDLETVVVSGGSSTVTYYDTINRQDTNDPATLTVAGQHNLDAREIQADAAFPVRVVIDDDELNGLYVPGEHYDVGDIATIHTVPPGASANDHDYDNFAIEVAAIRLEHDDAGNWFAVNELGAQYLVAQTSAFEERSSRIVHQVELCRPLLSADAAIDAYGFLITGTSPRAIVVPSGLTDSILIAFGAWDADTLPYSGTYGGALTAVPGSSIDSGGEAGMQAFYMLNPPADPGGTGTHLTIIDALSGGTWKGYFVLSGVNQSDPFNAVATASGTGTVSALSIGGAGTFINAVFKAQGAASADPVPSAGQTEAWSDNGASGIGGLEFGGGFGDATPGWTFSESDPWAAIGIAVNGIGVGGGDGHPDLIGTSIRAKRCDDTEHYHAAGDPTVNDDTSLGFRNNTMWINESTGAMFLLLDNADGAADWLAVGGTASLIVEDEGTPLATDATTLDFVGAGVTASGAGAEKTITISGAPTGAAGGDLSGTYPNPSVVDDSHSHTSATVPVGESRILLADGRATPFSFDDLLQMDDGSDFMWSDS